MCYPALAQPTFSNAYIGPITKRDRTRTLHTIYRTRLYLDALRLDAVNTPFKDAILTGIEGIVAKSNQINMLILLNEIIGVNLLMGRDIVRKRSRHIFKAELLAERDCLDNSIKSSTIGKIVGYCFKVEIKPGLLYILLK